MRRLIDRIRWSLSGDRDLDEEIGAHIDLEAARLQAEQGLTPAEAEAAAPHPCASGTCTPPFPLTRFP